MRKTILTILLVLFIPVLCSAGVQDMLKGVVERKNGSSALTCGSCQGPASCTTAALGCTKRETFDADQNCDSVPTNTNCDFTWTTVVAAPDFDNTSYELAGTYACYSTGSGVYQHTGTITAADEYYMAFYVYVETLPSAASVMANINNSFTSKCMLRFTNAGAWTVQSAGGTLSSAGSTTITAGNGYYIKLRGKLGTGANAECEGWVSANGTTWTDTLSSTDGTWTEQLDRGYIGANNGTAKYHFDDFRMYTGDIQW